MTTTIKPSVLYIRPTTQTSLFWIRIAGLTFESFDEVRKLGIIPNSDREETDPVHGTRTFSDVAAWNGHEFELLKVFTVHERWPLETDWFYLQHTEDSSYELQMGVHYPIDQRTKPSDWLGATGAKPNETNTGWLPIRTTQGAHHDIALSFEDGVAVAFNPELEGLNAEIMGLDPRDAPHARKVDEYGALVKVKAKVVEKVAEVDAQRYLGYYIENAHPDVGHVTGAVKDAFAAVKGVETALWRKAPTALSRIEAGINNRASRTVETRWDMEARLAAEAKKKAEAD